MLLLCKHGHFLLRRRVNLTPPPILLLRRYPFGKQPLPQKQILLSKLYFSKMLTRSAVFLEKTSMPSYYDWAKKYPPPPPNSRSLLRKLTFFVVLLRLYVLNKQFVAYLNFKLKIRSYYDSTIKNFLLFIFLHFQYFQ